MWMVHETNLLGGLQEMEEAVPALNPTNRQSCVTMVLAISIHTLDIYTRREIQCREFVLLEK